MPVVDGKKMACRPCITGHRSTKCTHTVDRQLYEVRKPGRPLSACPHLSDHLCGCVSVITAIPKKAKCGCDTSDTAVPLAQPLPSAVPNPPSPGKVAFKVKKTSSRPASRKQSRDLGGLDLDDLSTSAQFQPQRPQTIAPAPSNGIATAGMQNFAPALQQNIYIVNTSERYSNSAPTFQSYGMMPPMSSANGTGVMSGMNSSMSSSNGNTMMADMNGPMINGQYTTFQSMEEASYSTLQSVGEVDINGNQYHTNQAPNVGYYNPQLSGMSATGPGMNAGPPISSTANGVPFDNSSDQGRASQTGQAMYSTGIQQPTLYQYPASYGSSQHPLQMAEWVQGHKSHMYSQPQMQNNLANPFATSRGFELETLHECSCGDGCQCDGCAAHPFNKTTIESVQLTHEAFLNEQFTPSSDEFPSPDRFTAETRPDFSNGSSAVKSESRSSEENSPSDNGSTEQIIAPAENYIWARYFVGGMENCGPNCQCDNCYLQRSMHFNSTTDQTLGNGSSFASGQDPFLGSTIAGMTDGTDAANGIGGGAKKSCCG